MNSEQKYSGRGNTAPTNEQMVSDWQIDFLRRAADDFQIRGDLFGLIDQARELHETTDPTNGLCQLLNVYLCGETSVRIERSDLVAVVNLIAFVNRLKEDFYCFDVTSDYVNGREKALKVGREVRGE